MITLISTILGIISSLGPEMINLFGKKEDNDHARKMAELDIQKTEMEARNEIAIQGIKADSDESKSLRLHDASISGGKFIDFVRATIRPTITYLFFMLFLVVKGMGIYLVIQANPEVERITSLWSEIYPIVWDEQTQAIFGAILGFWFGNRAIEKARGYVS